jgi:hypothetical protein
VQKRLVGVGAGLIGHVRPAQQGPSRGTLVLKQLVQGDVGSKAPCSVQGDVGSKAPCEMRAAGQLGACSERESTPGGLSVDRKAEPSLTTISEAGESALDPEPSIPHPPRYSLLLTGYGCTGGPVGAETTCGVRGTRRVGHLPRTGQHP